MTNYDVAVIGAGPAGAVFARELALCRPDLRTVLINGQDAARPKPCGGLLSPDAQRLLAAQNITLPKEILADPQIFAVQTIDLGTGKVRYYSRSYLNMDRSRFDRWLLERVPGSVSVLSGRVRHIDREGALFRLEGTFGAVRAKYAVGADGSRSLLRRYLRHPMPHRYVSIQEWYPDQGKPLPYYSCIFDAETGDSCSWTIHKDGLVLFGGAFRKEGCREAFAKQRARLEAQLGTQFGPPVKREACLVSSPRRPRDLDCGEGCALLLGEAAGFISASSFEGISNAIQSGRLLAAAFAAAGREGDVLSAYRRATRSLRWRLCGKMLKRRVLCSPFWRRLIMGSGIASVAVEKRR